ncbi:pyruvate dehydrogenase (acetyl-transferring) E1 component subunit alpha [Pueribacillus theae]|uniref:Pyruvate dehydrogenase E1 component subunit alpha n=1 Tax=Pueribacillus theae TaxID=2171751 RepID=A0A2U1JKL9_9BACI|nr:pyruvate dehydrogenase (acetyl-transferring) E1 component subunit alpha [Pueribacillus theae]PWA05534.1 pyruvate dehydrogenase (acetyl-transferring) E1 component subunit alpha [Pueribacillus theae]
MWIEQSQLSYNMVKVLDDKGKPIGDLPNIDNDTMVNMYKWMLLSRVYDERSLKLQRQGRIGTTGSFAGQEAAQVGSALALDKSDWVFPSYREQAVFLVRGIPISDMYLSLMGHIKGGSRPEGVNVLPLQIIIAAQTLHATGSAFASKYRKEKTVSVAYFGDGATSQGDFHEALNFAGVNKLPVIFFVQNNQWAISVPFSKQTASNSIAQKALAYGISGVQVDGNDVLAVYQTMKEAIEKAKSGYPVLIEAVTFRQGPHTTADDPTKYRDQEEVEVWLKKDPTQRMKAFLTDQGLWNDELEEKELAIANDKISEAIQIAESTPKSSIEDIFDLVYADIPNDLQEQKASFSKGGIF